MKFQDVSYHTTLTTISIPNQVRAFVRYSGQNNFILRKKVRVRPSGHLLRRGICTRPTEIDNERLREHTNPKAGIPLQSTIRAFCDPQVQLMRVFLTSKEINTELGSELLELCQRVASDGRLDLDEIIELRKWLRSNQDSEIISVRYLSEIIGRITKDLKIDSDEQKELHLAIESVIPKKLRHSTTAARRKVEDARKEARKLRKVRQEATLLKIEFTDSTLREELEGLISVKYRTTNYRDLPPTKEQLAFGRKIGIKPSENWTRSQFDEWIQNSKDHPTFGPKIKHQLYEESLKDNTEYCGGNEELAKVLTHWEEITISRGVHALIVNRGSKRVAYVVEFEGVDIERGKKPFVKVLVLLPKKYREYGETCVEMDKEASFDASKIAHVQKLTFNCIDDISKLEIAQKQSEEIAQSLNDA